MKSIVVLAALLAVASALTTDVHINTTSTSANGTTGHNATSTSSASASATTASSSSAAATTATSSSSSSSSTTGAPVPANVTVTAITTIWDYSGVNQSIACGGNVSAIFTATFTTGVCAFYPIQVPGVNASVRVYWFGETATMSLWLAPTDVPHCDGPAVGFGTFTNGGCDSIDIHLSTTVTQKVWVTSRWGALFTTGTTGTTTTSTTTTTGDAGAGSTIVPSFVAMLFATLLLVARFF